MGLFGYNQKDYAINNDRFQTKLWHIQELITEDKLSGKMGLNENAPSVGTAINLLMRKIGTYPYSGSGKELEKIDARVDALLGDVESDIQNNSIDALIYHVTLLQEIVHDERRHGKQKYDAEELEGMKKLSRMITQSNLLKSERNRIYLKKKEIEDQYDRLRATLDENEPVFDDLDQDYGELERREAEIQTDLGFVNNAISQDKEIQRAIKRSDVTRTVVENGISGKDATKILNSFLNERNKALEDIETKGGVLTDYRNENGDMREQTGGKKSSLRDKMAARDASRIDAAINNADATSLNSSAAETRHSSLRNR